MNNRDITISPDAKELYFCSSLGNSDFNTIIYMKEMNGKWSDPEIADFASDPHFKFYGPSFSPDGEKLFFVTNMPVDSGAPVNEDVWVMERSGDTWDKPYNIGAPVNSDAPEFFPSVTKNGTLFILPGTIMKAESVKFIFPGSGTENMKFRWEGAPQIDAGISRFNAFIAPDETYCIVPVYGLPDSYGGTDYYISYQRKDGSWTEAINSDQTLIPKAGRNIRLL